jgi:hypothetical protein
VLARVGRTVNVDHSRHIMIAVYLYGRTRTVLWYSAYPNYGGQNFSFAYGFFWPIDMNLTVNANIRLYCSGWQDSQLFEHIPGRYNSLN